MKKLLILFLVLSLRVSAETPHEGFDANAAASFQTYPLGVLATANGGYGRTIWKDEKEPDENFWRYGYLHAAAKLQTAAVTNRVTAAIEFYPVSLFGLSAGGGVDERNYRQFSGIDCNNLVCDHTLDFKFVKAQLVAGFSKFALIAAARYDWYHSDNLDRPFYDYMSYLIGRPGSDDLRSLTVLALYRPTPTFHFGALGIYQSMIYSGSNSAAIYGVVNYVQGPWQATAGLGDFHNDFEPQHASAIFSMQYTFQKSIALVD